MKNNSLAGFFPVITDFVNVWIYDPANVMFNKNLQYL